MTIGNGFGSQLSHIWSADDWDWPLQLNEQMVRIENTKNYFRVLLDVRYFAPKEIQVKTFGDELLWIHCKQTDDGNGRNRCYSREFHRAYRLPDGVDTSTLKFLLRKNGSVLLIEAQKKRLITAW